MSRLFARSRRLLLTGTAVLLGAAMAVTAGPAGAAPTDTGPAVPVPAPGSFSLPAVDDAAPGADGAHAGLAPGLANQVGRVKVFVQLSGDGAADAAADAQAAGKNASAQASAARAARSAARSHASDVLAGARAIDRGTKELFQVGNAVPGVAIDADITAVDAIADRSDVVQVFPLVPKHPLSSNGSELTNVLATWQNTGNYGTGVRVGIIDTGIDYTHADFGGPGTQDAWDAAHGNETDPNWYSTLTSLAKAKVAGGYDFVGDQYNADPDADDYQPVAHPDPDPVDCQGHGSHVAGITAGYGENGDGTTFTGNYNGLTSETIDQLKIAPGMAPQASIYALKVFGCTGSTDAVIPALDWALDPNGDGNFSDHLDIVNMSLGSDYGTVDDPENLVVNNLAKHGVLPVIAMGNAGDLTDIGGAPGNAVRSLAVASSVDSYVPMNMLQVDAPADVAGPAAGQVSQAYDWVRSAPATGDVVALSSGNADGCDSLSADDAAAVAGKVAWLTWDSNDPTRRCGSAARAGNVAAAGAIGAVFTGDVFPFTAGIAGSDAIPVLQLTPDATGRLAPYVGNGLTVTFDAQTAQLSGITDDSLTDTLSSFSSRGTHGSLGVVKPDLAAPGDTIVSAGVGGGTEGASMSGTSMATPHAAGVAALVVAKHRNWTPEQVKADLMNTANHDVYTSPGHGAVYGPVRVGSGRIDALGAVNNTILAYSVDDPGAVSVSFGVTPVPTYVPVITKIKRVRIANTGSKAQTVSLGYRSATDQPGVTYAAFPSSVRVNAGSSTVATVTMTIRTAQLRRTIDPTMAAVQLGAPRQFVSGASGWLTVAPQSATAGALRVPVYGAAKPTSATVTQDWGRPNARSMRISNWGFQQGSGPEAFTSLASVMDLGATSPKMPQCKRGRTLNCTVNDTAKSGDLQYVGAGATPVSGSLADGWLYFGISTYGEWATIGNSVIPYVDIDTTGDGSPDYEVYVQNYPETDLLLANLVDLSTGKVIDAEPVNFQFGDVDTNVFDSDAVVIPVWAAMIGVQDGMTSFPITYTVGTAGYYTNDPNGLIDTAGPVSFDVAKPKVQVSDPLWLDRGGVQIPYTLNGSKPRKGQPVAKALVLHLQGATGRRAEVVNLRYF